jgi:hypothetical protein
MRSIVYIMAVCNIAKHQGGDDTCKLINCKKYLYALDAHDSDAQKAVWMHKANTLRTFVIYYAQVVICRLE